MKDKNFKIVHVITRMDTVGGAQIHVRDIVIYLKKNGYDVQLIAGGMGSVHESLKDIPIYIARHLVRELNLILDIRAFFELRKLLRTMNPDLVATHSSKAGIIGRLAAASLHIPVIFTAHGWSFTDGIPNPKKLIYQCVEKIAGYFSSGIIAVSKYDWELSLKRKVIRKDKIICIQNGVHDVINRQNMRGEAKEVRLIMVARFAHPKMQLQLLESLVLLNDLKWTMHFVGDGPEREMVERFAIENGMIHKVQFEGWRQDIDDMLAKSHIFILLSQYEGLPLSILEAMRAGLPIIATDVGGVKEAVTAENGILVQVDDSNALTEALERMIGDRELQIRMGTNGRKLFEEKFSFHKMMEETLAYYNKIAGKNDWK